MQRNSATHYQIVAAVVIVALGGLASLFAVRFWDHMIRSAGIDERRSVALGLAAGGGRLLAHSREFGEDAESLLQSFLEAATGRAELDILRMALLSADGSVLVGDPISHSAIPGAIAAGQMTQWEISVPEAPAGALGVAVPLGPESGGGLLYVEFDMAPIRGRFGQIVTLVLIAIAGLAITGFLIFRWVVGRWVVPISELSRRMTEVERGNLDVSIVEERRKDEVGVLVRHFNAMLESIQRSRLESVDVARKQANIEKFAALGRLSAGLAHEINNPVGGILTCLETMRELSPGSDRYQDYLALVRSGLERIGKIVRQLLHFSRQRGGENEDVDLNEVLKEVLVLSLFHNREAEVEVTHGFREIPLVRGAPDLLNQLFLNLVLNALQAMPDGGSLHVRTSVEDDHVAVAFEDSGPGVPDENIERIFEPFFTTKEVGVGTGLGLSVALGIVEAHGGSIEVRNRPAGGAVFEVRIPVGAHDAARLAEEVRAG